MSVQHHVLFEDNCLTHIFHYPTETGETITGPLLTNHHAKFASNSFLDKITYVSNKLKTQEGKDIVKEVGYAIPPSSSQTVTTLITVRRTTSPSFLNCRIIKSEYKLKGNSFFFWSYIPMQEASL